MADHPLLAASAVVIGLLILYLYRVNQSWMAVPPEATELVAEEWSTELIRETYEHVKKNRIDFSKHLPPRQDRRYVVVGGSGLVGGDIVLQLLERGQSAESIRIVDFAPLNREKMLRSRATECGFVKADISSSASVEAAFAQPWPVSVAEKPLTVFHTAALIRPAERKLIFYDRIRNVNVVGTANVVDAARKAGADIFVATSSASVGMLPVKIWGWPWQRSPKNHCQVYTEDDFDKPLRPHGEFFANYGYSKAEAERLVCGANSDGFRTGVIRPGNGVYGDPVDAPVGTSLNMAKRGEPVTSWTPHVVQNFVASRNVSLAHLLFEAALLPSSPSPSAPLPKCAGRPFNISDPGPPISFSSFYRLASALSPHPYNVSLPPPVTMFLLAYAIEAWCVLLHYVPAALRNRLGLREPSGLVHNLQPAIFTVTSHAIAVDAKARKSVAEGGLGYAGGVETLEGMCELLADFNAYEEEARRMREGKGEGVEGGTMDKLKKAVVPRPEPVGV